MYKLPTPKDQIHGPNTKYTHNNVCQKRRTGCLLWSTCQYHDELHGLDSGPYQQGHDEPPLLPLDFHWGILVRKWTIVRKWKWIWWANSFTSWLPLRHSDKKVKVNLMIPNISISQIQIQTQLQVGSDDDHHRWQRPPPQNPAGKTDWRILCSFRGSFHQLFASFDFQSLPWHIINHDMSYMFITLGFHPHFADPHRRQQLR